MNSNKLILRKLTSDFPGFPDVTLSSVLSHEELDSNFLYLKGQVIHDAKIDLDSNLVLEKINGDNILLPLSGVTISGVTLDTFVTGGTYSNNEIEFENNQGNTFTVTGLENDNIFATGLTYDTESDLLTLTNNDGSTISTTGLSTEFTDTNEFVTGGTVSIPTNRVTFTTNANNSFDVIGFDEFDTFITGGTFNITTSELNINNNKGGVITIPLPVNDTNDFTTGGTLNTTNGIITFNTNNGDTYDVTGFTGLQGTSLVSGTFSNETLTLTDSDNNDVVINGFNKEATGLEAFNEGNGIGWRYYNRVAANYGNVGLNATDLSTSTITVTPKGALGENSLAGGLNTVSLGRNSLAMGNNTLADGENATSLGTATIATGENSTAIGNNTSAQGIGSFAGGLSSIISGDYSFGFGTVTTSNEFSIGLGKGLFSRYDSETVVGRFNIDNGFINPTDPDSPNSKVFTVGNGVDDANRNDAFSIFNNGAAYFDPVILSGITNGTKGMYAYDDTDNVPKYHDGTTWRTFGPSAQGDIYITSGTYDNGTSTITFNDNQGGSFAVTGIESGSVTEDNFSRTITITSTELNACTGCTGTTLEEKIVSYVNNLNYNKQSQDADIWVEFIDDAGIFTTEFTTEFN